MDLESNTSTSRLGQCGRILSEQIRPAVWFLAILIFFISLAFAQMITADILGTVADPSGAVVPNANITLVNLATNETRTVQSNGSGVHSLSLLAVEDYSITAKAIGFQA